MTQHGRKQHGHAPSQQSSTAASFPGNVENVLEQLEKFVKQHGTKWNRAKASDLQHRIDNDLFCLKPDRRTSRLTPFQRLKLLDILCQFYEKISKESCAQHYLYFDLIFCGREGEALLHDVRILALSKLCCHALQYPVYALFDDVASWLLKIGSSKSYAQRIVDELVQNFVMVREKERMYEYLLPLHKNALEFASFFVIHSIREQTVNAALVTILGHWLASDLDDFLRIFADNPHMAEYFANECFEHLLRHDCSHSIRDDVHDRFHFVITQILQRWKSIISPKVPLKCHVLLDCLENSSQLSRVAQDNLADDVENAFRHGFFPVAEYQTKHAHTSLSHVVAQRLALLVEPT
ncbi:Protein Y56A3A.31 [Aphelenchoides avenae]|nr:Protein Y56A3A.31 [Aphelenchus avenae]